MSERIDAPAKLIERLRPVQEQINRMQAEIQAALFGAQVALDVPDEWVWDGSGWVAPEVAPHTSPIGQEALGSGDGVGVASAV